MRQLKENYSDRKSSSREYWVIKSIVLASVTVHEFHTDGYYGSYKASGRRRSFHRIKFYKIDVYQYINVPALSNYDEYRYDDNFVDIGGSNRIDARVEITVKPWIKYRHC